MVQSLWDSVARVFGQGRIDNDMASNKRRRHTPDQIIRKLAEGNKLLGTGTGARRGVPTPGDRRIDMASLDCPVRRDEGHEAKRLKELEAENARLKKLVANQALDIDMLKEISAGNF